MTTQNGLGETGLRRTLMARATFGPTRTDRDELDQLGFDGWLDAQLNPGGIDDSALSGTLASFPWMGMTAAQLRQSYGGGGWRLSEESKSVRILRAKDSKRQVFERVVDFWNDHFNVPFTAQDANFLRPVHERDVIRRHAFGSFPELLTAVATSPAMGAYLDQDSNQSGMPNENYARELLELHTLGEGNGYTEADVREVARCFTGWGYVRHWESGPFGTFRFDAGAHDSGVKVVLGKTIPAGGGVEDGLRVLRELSNRPATARYVSQKLVRFLLGEFAATNATLNGVPLVDLVTQRYLATGGDIRAMLRVILSRNSFRAAQPYRRRRLKQPFHFGISFLRALEVDITDPSTAVYGFAGLGQVPFEWPDPDGYPDDADAWMGALAPRWRFASSILNGWTSWTQMTPASLLALCAGAGPDQWGRCISAVLSGGEFDVRDTAAIQAFVDQAAGSPTDADLIGAFELGASSPGFQTV